MPTFSLVVAPRKASQLRFNAPTTLSYHSNKLEFTASVAIFAPLDFRRRIVRPVSYYALFKGWLLLSQPPGCLDNSTSFTTQITLGTLAGDLGSFPRVYGTSLSQTDSLDNHIGIRSLLGVGTVVYRPSPNRALPLVLNCKRLYLNIFRREPAISRFDGNFNTNHRSSKSFAALGGSVLPQRLSWVQPAHGSLTWFRV